MTVTLTVITPIGAISTFYCLQLSFLQLKTDKNAARDPRINLGALLMNILSYYGNEFDYDNFGLHKYNLGVW